ncbi:MAG: twin-arginine translocase subunit TatC [Saprospiraceae bacterium]|nr:twin-arginine translocase subunit TatC [Candidatus Opimibacter skivensis]
MAKVISNKNPNEMSFFEHIEELRWHLFRAAISVLVVTIIVFLLKDFVFQEVILGPTTPDFITYQLFCDYLPQFCFYPQHLQIITRDIQEQFISHIKVSLWLGFIVSFPYILFEVWRFIKPGLYKKEIKAARGMVFICSFLFLSGVSFGYFIIAPIAITFLSTYSVSPDIANTTTLDALVNSITMFTIPVGLIFETPVILYFLAKIGLVSSEFLVQYRKHSLVIIVIVAAVITPGPDVFSQMLVALPLYLLYEVSIIVVKRIDKERAAKEASESLDANSN